MVNKFVGAGKAIHAGYKKLIQKASGQGKTTGKEVKVAEQSVEVDPRSKTTADKAFNLIGTGKPEMPVGGQKRMLAEKKGNSKAY